MIKVLFTIICILISISGILAQTKKTSAQTPVKKAVMATEVTEKDWKEMIKNLEAENWNQASLFISQTLTKIKTENSKKQLARLRYFYLYALAGKVSQQKMAYAELEKISDSLIGKEFLMPPRAVLSDCKQSLNFVCPVENYVQSVRFTASNKNFDAIHSFEYVQLPEKFDTEKYSGKFVVLGGRLKKVEFNPKKESNWIMRLYFENGNIEIVG